MAGRRVGQTSPAMSAALASLPGDPLTPFLWQPNEIGDEPGHRARARGRMKRAPPASGRRKKTPPGVSRGGVFQSVARIRKPVAMRRQPTRTAA